MDRLKTAQADALRKAMLEAEKSLQEVQAEYDSALELAGDTELNAERAAALRAKGWAYAQALSAYNNATMAWLKYVDVQLHSKARATSD